MTDETYEVHISRYFDAPPELVYRAFIDPEQLAQWFGPLMFTVPLDTVSVDARVGGHWRMTMVGKDNSEWKSPLDATFTEVIDNKLLVGYELAKDFPGLEDGTKITMSIEFIPEGDGTRLELRQGPMSPEVSEMASIGWGQSFHKLDALLATPAKFRNDPNEYEGRPIMTTITPFLWFDDNADEAIERYRKVFSDAEVVEETRTPDGKLFIATIRLQGLELVLMNGGPDHKLTDAFSLSVGVENQREVDEISDGLIEGGGEQGPCGWLVDAFGLSWQVVPSALGRLLGDPDRERASRVQQAMMQMTRLNVQALQDAYDGSA